MNDCPFKPGDLLMGKYRVERVVGYGAMGAVLLARHVALDQRVAIKAMTALNPKSEHYQRFLREARAMVRLKSEHAVRVLDVSMDESPYIVMEFLDGHDLSAELQMHGALPVETAVEYALQACEALGEAHAAGIVHRDLKPANLFLSVGVGGQLGVKVCDFGIAKVEGDVALTADMASMGSPLYMAPEQLRSARDADARADIWGLGVTVYELLTGRTPFPGESVTEVCTRVSLDPPIPLLSLRPEAPPGLVSVLEQCLEKNRERRFPNIAALAAALAPYAPERAKMYVERTAAVLGEPVVAARPTSVLPVQAQTVATIGGPRGATNSAIVRAAPPAPPRRGASTVVIAALAIGILASAGILGLVWRMRPRPASVASAAPEDAAPAAASNREQPAEPGVSPIVSAVSPAPAPMPSGSGTVVASAPVFKPKPRPAPQTQAVPTEPRNLYDRGTKK